MTYPFQRNYDGPSITPLEMTAPSTLCNELDRSCLVKIGWCEGGPLIFQVPELPTAPAARLIHCLEHEDRGNINDGSHWKDGASIRVCFSVSKVAALSEPNSRVYIQTFRGVAAAEA